MIKPKARTIAQEIRRLEGLRAQLCKIRECKGGDELVRELLQLRGFDCLLRATPETIARLDAEIAELREYDPEQEYRVECLRVSRSC